METRFSLSFRSIGNDNDDCYGLSVNSVSGYISLPHFTNIYIYIYMCVNHQPHSYSIHDVDIVL